jgi:hypothetical protein
MIEKSIWKGVRREKKLYEKGGTLDPMVFPLK